MKITDKHTPILEVLNEESPLSSYGIAKKMYPKLNSNGWKAQSGSVFHYLQDLLEYNIVKGKKENGKTIYSLVEENIKFDYKNPRTIVGGMIVYYKKAFLIRINSVWEVITFSD